MADIIQKRRGTAANWASENPVLADGEDGFERDTNKEKIGDGVTAWNDLPYKGGGGGGGAVDSVNTKTGVVVLKEEDIMGSVASSINVAGNATINLTGKAHRILNFNGADPNITFSGLPTDGNSFTATFDCINTGGDRDLSVTNTVKKYGKFLHLSGRGNFITVMAATVGATTTIHMFFSQTAS